MVLPVESFNYDELKKYKPLKHLRGNPGHKSEYKYLSAVNAFDIETTRLEDVEQAFMYIWQFQIDEDFTVYGRDWDSFFYFITGYLMTIPKDCAIVVYVHNLSYEFQFLRGLYDFEAAEVFAVDSRRILKCTMFSGRVEFRCSMLLTNMDLNTFTHKFNVTHAKLPDYHYTEKRYPWTPLSDQELNYCVNDVWGLVEAVKAQMARDGDNLYSIPLTSTGYVRRDVRRAMNKNVTHTYMQTIFPDYDCYKALREAFRGGDTHANRFYTGVTLHDVKSADRSSSYPDVICNCEYPAKNFVKVTYSMTEKDINDLINLRHKAVLMRVRLEDVRLKDNSWGCPYLAQAKCRNVIVMDDRPAFDNGRILYADSLETTITDIDLKILEEEYSFSLTPIDVWYTSYKPLPDCLIKVICEYYTNKTALKGVDGQELLYMKSKNLLNSIYGMQAQDPVKIPIVYKAAEGDTEKDFYFDHSKTDKELLEESAKKAFTAYQWGVWTTALARLRLHEGIKLVHNKHARFIYCDTDSVKYIGEADFSEYNKKRIAASIRSGAHATDPAGTEHYMGVFEQESDYKNFRTLGAKKYCGTHDKNGDEKIELTCAGVDKKEGAAELLRAGGIDAFKPGLIFRAAGGMEAVYNDYPDIKEYKTENGVIPITSNVVLRDSEYTVGITAEYDRLLKYCDIEIEKLASISQEFTFC